MVKTISYMNPLLVIVPIFLLVMLFEHVWLGRNGRRIYSFRETMGNLYCATGQVFIEIFLKVPLIGLYYFFSEYSFSNAPLGWTKWLLLFIVVDFLFWLNHLIAHKIPWMWAIHGVHHQAEHFNFSVGLRLPWWHKFTSFWIVVPPALMGFDMTDYILVATLHGSAQIWTHTTLLPKRIPIFEKIFVTPSHHRVHHGKNKLYIDKNFGGILSVWDYLFKTYQSETEPVRFGIPRLKPRVNPWSSNLVQFFPQSMPKLPQHERLPLWEKAIIGLYTVALFFALLWVFTHEQRLNLTEQAIACGVVIFSMVLVGIWMDHREDWFRNVSRFQLSPRVTSFMMSVGMLFR